ncbi:amino acid permease-domain-containing protein [Aspergillus sergii]|uniref:Amino acid permease-domain-containing protein n=1 Tax=Aspergillus sergii TaxID=1034303 RepID=A0A5N6X393_9EURO|nr:amino acid permease-domain-containing protein [Aspergillus sergii]
MEPSPAVDHSPYAHPSFQDMEGKPKHLITTMEEGSIQIINSDAPLHFWGALGMNFTITAAPISIGSFLALTIGLGGPPFFFYGFLFTGLGQLVLCLAAAEIASSMPHPLGPQKYNRLAVVEVSIPQYSSHTKPWHHFLVYVGVCINALVVNLPKCRKVMDWSLSASLVFINGAALFVLITLLVRANPKQSATAVFVNVANNSGWGSPAVVFFLNVLPGLASLGTCDAATHMAEELELPTRDVPRVMIGSALLNYLVAIPTMIIFLFCIVNPEAMLSPVGGQPLIQLLSDGYASRVLTAIAGALIVVGFAIGSWAALISWSRLYWSFSRTKGFPFSNFTEKTTDGVPVNALILGTVLTIAIGAIQLGSSTALNAVLGGASLCSGFSWIVVFSFRVWRGHDALDPQRWLNLGQWGRPLSGFAILWNMWTITWASFPLFLPVTLSSMNWSSLVAVGVVVISFFYYILFYRHRSDEME